MKWADVPVAGRVYLTAVYLSSVPIAIWLLRTSPQYPREWYWLTLAAISVATVSVRLPRIPAIISMGDVFTLLALVNFGGGPTLVTYWATIITAHLTDVIRQKGLLGLGQMMWHRFLFNLACCVLCVSAMVLSLQVVKYWPESSSISIGLTLFAASIAWFVANTVTIALAICLARAQSFWTVWREGLWLYLLNFLGSAGAAGIISIFYQKAGFYATALSVPLAVVFFQLYRFYIEKFEQAQAHIQRLHTAYLQAIEALAGAVDAKDQYTHGHVRRVQAYAVALAECLGVADASELMSIRAGALLHDIGKISVPEYILNKPAALTETEFDRMRTHPVVGAQMLEGIEFPYPVVPLVRHHHERWDGKGYPAGLVGTSIPVGARILSLVDCYDALTTNRPYRSPLSRDKIVEFFRRESGTAYDPVIVETFLSHLDKLEASVGAVTNESSPAWWMTLPRQMGTVTTRTLSNDHVRAGREFFQVCGALQHCLETISALAGADRRSFRKSDVLAIVGLRLTEMFQADAAVFFLADLDAGTLVARHAVGRDANLHIGRSLRLEQKLSGWVAVNNQPLLNLPPFPDFIGLEGFPNYSVSMIAPMCSSGSIVGAISLYRRESLRFTESEFQVLDLIALRTARALQTHDERFEPRLVDEVVELPDETHLDMLLDLLTAGASRHGYQVAVVVIQVRCADQASLPMEGLSVAANAAKAQIRDSDILGRLSSTEFAILCDRAVPNQLISLKLRLAECFQQVFPAVSTRVGSALFPSDGGDLRELVAAARIQAEQDASIWENPARTFFGGVTERKD